MRADVQAGAAAVVPRGRARAARRRGVLRSVRVPDAAAPRRHSSARISRRASARSAIRCRAICACRTSGLKTREVLQLVPGTSVQAIERCSGHDGTYGVKKEYAAVSRKIARPVARQVDNAEAQHFTSDCPMAAEQIAGRRGVGRRADAPDPAAAQGVRHLSHGSGKTMDKLTTDDLLSLERYHKERPRMRAEVLAHKRHRQAPIGPNLTLYFEDRADDALSGPGDAARRAHLRVGGDRRGARRVQPVDSRWHEPQGHDDARVSRRRRAARGARALEGRRGRASISRSAT